MTRPKRVKKCPNCSAPVPGHQVDVCVLSVLMGVVRDREREDMTDKQLQALHAKVDIDKLWNDLGPIIDKLEDGGYQ